jgi:hypothetical protein
MESLFYNVRLNEDFKDKDTNSPTGFKVYNLSALKSGVTRLKETEFDIRGAVLLTSSVLQKYQLDYPRQAKSIPLARPCKYVHFLHAAGWPETNGACIGYYRLHYVNGKQEEIPLKYGQNVDDCVISKRPRSATPDMAWTGTNATGTALRLFHSVWTNSHPETVIDNMDFVSQDTKSAPILIAITTE